MLRWTLLVAPALLLAVATPADPVRIGLCMAFISAAYALPVAAAYLLPAALIWPLGIPLFQGAGESFMVSPAHLIVYGAAIRLTAQNREGRLEGSPLSPYAAFLIAAAASIVVGLVRGTLSSIEWSAVYLAQLVFLAGAFLVALHYGARHPKASIYAWSIPVLAVAAYGVAEAQFPFEFTGPEPYRTYERFPFDGDANHIAGLLAVGFCFGLGLAMSRTHVVLGVALVGVCLAAIAGAHSQSGSLALLIGASVFFASIRPRVFLFVTPLALLLALTGLVVYWESVFAPGSSMYDRLLAWQSAMSSVADHPVLGIGLGARHRSFYDNQYVMFVAETGLGGLSLFCVWLAFLFRAIFQQTVTTDDRAHQWIARGVLAGFVALVIQSGAASAFVVTAMAGPMYWIAGFVLARGRVAS